MYKFGYRYAYLLYYFLFGYGYGANSMSRCVVLLCVVGSSGASRKIENGERTSKIFKYTLKRKILSNFCDDLNIQYSI